MIGENGPGEGVSPTTYPLSRVAYIGPLRGSATEKDVLVESAGGASYRVSQVVAAVLADLPNHSSLEQLQLALTRRGLPISAATLASLLSHLSKETDLLSYEGQVVRTERGAPRGMTRLLSLPLRPVVAAARVGLLFTRHVPFWLGVCVGIHFAAYYQLGVYAMVDAFFATVDSTIFLLLAASLIHEIGHVAFALKAGVIPRQVGVGLYLSLPVFFTDSPGAWRLLPRERFAIDLGGIFFSLLTATTLFAFGTALSSPLLIAVGFAVDIQALISLLPYYKFDGYWAVSDLLAVPNLSKEALGILRRLVGERRIRTGGDWQSRALVGYALSAACVYPASLVFLYIATYTLLPHIAGLFSQVISAIPIVLRLDWASSVVLLFGRALFLAYTLLIPAMAARTIAVVGLWCYERIVERERLTSERART